mgnify:CR=1 FL=1
MSYQNGRVKLVNVIGAMKPLPASAGVPGAPMHVVVPGSANTFGDLRDQQQNVEPSIDAQNPAALQSEEIAK